MGANTKEKGSVFQCGECDRQFHTNTALKIHTTVKHSEKSKHSRSSQQSEHKSLQGKKAECASKDEKKTALVQPTSRASKRLQGRKSTSTEMIVIDENSSSNAASQTMFGCPKCEKVFQIYFTACRHIQKRHCLDEDGNPIPPDEMDLLKPLRQETCSGCSKRKLTDEHCCGDFPSGDFKYVEGYSCLGCKRNFPSLGSFDHHIAPTHSEEIDTMIFDTFDEFVLWKSDLEKQLQVKYQTLSRTTQTQYYHCSYVSPKNTAGITYLCPSVLVAKTYSKNIQINYYKPHFEHMCKYKMPKQFQSYLLTGTTAIMTNVSDKKDCEGLYIKFRTLMRSILTGALSAKAAKLKKMHYLAEEMQMYLHSPEDEENDIKKPAYIKDVFLIEDNNIDDDIDHDERVSKESAEKSTDKENSIRKSMNDDQIAEVLEQPRASARLKRKSESSETVLKKKSVKKNKASLKESNAIAKDAKFESPKSGNRSPVSQSPSFVDSYKQFIDNSCGEPQSPPRRKAVKKEIVKTKIGQFIPSPKTGQHDNENNETIKKKRKSSVTSPKSTTVLQSGSSTPLSPKRDEQTAESDDFDNVVKETKDTINSSQTSIGNIKLEEIEYEVLEQEDDCNILVLKI